MTKLTEMRRENIAEGEEGAEGGFIRSDAAPFVFVSDRNKIPAEFATLYSRERERVPMGDELEQVVSTLVDRAAKLPGVEPTRVPGKKKRHKHKKSKHHPTPPASAPEREKQKKRKKYKDASGREVKFFDTSDNEEEK